MCHRTSDSIRQLTDVTPVGQHALSSILNDDAAERGHAIPLLQNLVFSMSYFDSDCVDLDLLHRDGRYQAGGSLLENARIGHQTLPDLALTFPIFAAGG
ncbi:hypothetical protein KC19_VG135500 [Ceratodon purpureus]|uniref:Uncharacterized protein n=1 Tax=Ceratodon purpureus TaxID=3225 RepID=A0A8T0HPV6_CERPU|nr:hypothetical protein KC19_VG135500 [Ceratodon purpureus]